MSGKAPAPASPEDVQERIRKLAYAMWEAGGCQHGRALEYWLEAERRILGMRRAEADEPVDTPPPEHR